MNKVTVKTNPYNLIGELISKNETLNFKAINKKGEEVSLSNIKGKKVISAFPALNTRVCDAQTADIARKASKYSHINFISITLDDLDVINQWCLAHDFPNVEIWSDLKFKEFGTKTKSIIKDLNKLARGFIILDENNKIIDISYKDETSEMPDFELVEKYL